MMKRFSNNFSIAVGDIVSVTVPKEVRSRTRGIHLLGVVFSVSKRAGSVAVVVKQGILAEQGTVHWLSSDKIEKKPDNASFALEDEVKQYRAMILEGSFKKESVPLVSLAAAHRALVDVKHQGIHRCKCKTGKCTNCICSKNNTLCFSGCGCAGNCNRTLLLAEQLKQEKSAKK